MLWFDTTAKDQPRKLDRRPLHQLSCVDAILRLGLYQHPPSGEKSQSSIRLKIQSTPTRLQPLTKPYKR